MQEGTYLALAVICSLTFSTKAAAEVPLDLAPDAVDDMYEGCTKDALGRFVLSDLLKEELNRSAAFREAWLYSQTAACTELIPGGVKEHTTALQTHAKSTDAFRQDLNDAVYAYGTNATTYEDSFHFKSLHFLLMDSIRLLYPGICKTVYAFSQPKVLPSSAPKGSRVRLGRFYLAHSSLDILKESDIDSEVILGITSCFFADLGDNICHSEPSTLLSPTEEFEVEDVQTVTDEENDVSYHLILLKHSQLKSKHNCYAFSRSSDKAASHLSVLVLMASFLFIEL